LISVVELCESHTAVCSDIIARSTAAIRVERRERGGGAGLGGLRMPACRLPDWSE
jgi:hypothetical protein